MKMKDLSKVDLPREKFEKYGNKKLSEHELLAIILGSGIKGVNVLELSKKVLKTVHKAGIEKIDLKTLLSIKGLGKAKAIQVLAALELGKRIIQNKNTDIISPSDVWKLCSDFYDSKKEHFVAFYLDTQNQLIERQVISIGTLNSSLVHPREVFEPALTLHAASVIIAHNHPSGSLEPSPEDIEVTNRLKQAGKMLGLEVLDHIIVTKSAFLSFQEKKLL